MLLVESPTRMVGPFQEDNKVPEHWHPGLPRDLDRYPLKDQVRLI